MNDAQLVREARAGQTSAYEVLVRRWSARLVAYIRAKVRCCDAAEDLAQDCFLKAFRRLPSLANPEKFGAWLLSIGHNAAVDWLKSKKRMEVQLTDMGVEAVHPGVMSSIGLPDESLARIEESQRLRQAIDELPGPLREVLLIYYYDGVTYREIANMLGVSAATVNARLTKARARLRAVFAQESTNETYRNEMS